MSESNSSNTNPLLYNNIVALNTIVHKDLKFDPKIVNYNFAKESNSFMLTISEFVPTAKTYPIVFIGDKAVPTIVVGIQDKNNSFVNGKGAWEKDAYIPLYVRRYPFILAKGEKEDLTDAPLCFDEDYKGIGAKGEPMFENGQPTPITTRAIDACVFFSKEVDKTEAFSAALKKYDLLMTQQIVVTGENALKLGDTDEYTFGPFQIINVEKLHQLPNEVVIEWFKLGWLQAIYSQIASMGHWDRLVTNN